MAVENNRDLDTLSHLLATMEELEHLKDLDALLDRILLEARRLTNADAGSIYLVDGQVLRFSYVHNDSLLDFRSSKYIYTAETVEINNRSIAGYVAATGESVIVDNAYDIPDHLPFTFNPAFDVESGYVTKSILSVPLKTSRDKIVGVLQIINALDHNRRIVNFTEKDNLISNYFAKHAAVAIERALMTREVILRMVRMCELRDPRETGPHANRVAAYSSEIYQRLALNKGIALKEIKKHKDLLRIAAMLHDLGKIAISDAILRKPEPLTEEEFAVMQYHTILGARFFENPASELDLISAEIALNHHERWDGQGYPGKIHNLFALEVQLGPGKKGKEIPLPGRIVALADVYDALISKRIYKDSYPEDFVLDYLRAQSGKQFDPEVVEAFFSIYDVIAAIRKKYSEESPAAREAWLVSSNGPEW